MTVDASVMVSVVSSVTVDAAVMVSVVPSVTIDVAVKKQNYIQQDACNTGILIIITKQQ